MSEFRVEVESDVSEADKELITYFANLRRNSLDTLENAARQLIGLVTTLLGVFFGVLALRGDVNAALAGWEIKGFGILAVVGYFGSLWFALEVVTPRRLDIPSSNLTAMRNLLTELFDHKSNNLRWAQICFVLATLALLIVTLLLIIKL